MLVILNMKILHIIGARMKSRYEVLLTGLRLESLTEAAKQTGYTQSGITHLLSSIEKEWGVTLLIRSKKENIITPEGKELLPSIQTLVNAHRSLEEKIASIKGSETGLVRIGSITSVSLNILPDLLAAFNKEHPGIRFEIDHLSFHDIEQAIIDETIDVGFLQNHASSNKISCTPFYPDEAVAVLPKNYFKNEEDILNAPALSPEIFSRNPLIMVGMLEGDFHHYLREHDIQTTIPFTAQEDELAASLVEKHLGVGIGYRLSLQRISPNVILKPLTPPLTRTIMLATKKGAHTSLALECFLSFTDAYRQRHLS